MQSMRYEWHVHSAQEMVWIHLNFMCNLVRGNPMNIMLWNTSHSRRFPWLQENHTNARWPTFINDASDRGSKMSDSRRYDHFHGEQGPLASRGAYCNRLRQGVHRSNFNSMIYSYFADCCPKRIGLTKNSHQILLESQIWGYSERFRLLPAEIATCREFPPNLTASETCDTAGGATFALHLAEHHWNWNSMEHFPHLRIVKGI